MEQNQLTKLHRTLKFRSNIHCDECVKKVSPFLDRVPNVFKWNVDFSSAEKLLTVTGENIHSSAIRNAVRSAGYEIHNAGSLTSRLFSSFKKSYEKDCCK